MNAALPSEPPHVPRLPTPCFLVICRDGPGAGAMRARYLDGHLQHVEANWTRYITAGPVREPGGEALVGSVFLVLADTLDAARRLMQDDPYITCGLYSSIEYKEFTNSIGLYMGGRIWESRDAIRHRAAGGPPDDLSKGAGS
ncbi:MAG: YciI family protein [Hyphomonas sp.]|uniref:YciI family protein n=1 Tax=Hyphomonas sp. TaxID=87 RepID=UPI0034A08BC4